MWTFLMFVLVKAIRSIMTPSSSPVTSRQASHSAFSFNAKLN